MQALCPNCQRRPEATQVDYDEVLRASYHVKRSAGWKTTRWSSTTRYGRTRLCTQCAAGYQRMVQWRTLGWKMANRGLIVLMLSGVFFSMVVATTALKNSWLAYLAGAVVVLAALAMLVGSGLIISARIMRRSTLRFLSKMPPSNAAQTVLRS